MRELIDDGATGILATSVPDAARAVARVQVFDREAIRASATRRFGRDRMVDEYVDLYRRVLAAVEAPAVRLSAVPGAGF